MPPEGRSSACTWNSRDDVAIGIESAGPRLALEARFTKSPAIALLFTLVRSDSVRLAQKTALAR
jgi:hypothetical protein